MISIASEFLISRRCDNVRGVGCGCADLVSARAVPGFWKFSKDLGFLIDGLDGAGCGGRAIEHDVVVDIA